MPNETAQEEQKNQQSAPIENAEQPAEQEVEVEAEAETEKGEEPKKEKGFDELRERLNKSEAREQLLREQLEALVINQARSAPEKETVVDDGFKQAGDEELDAMTPSQLLRYTEAKKAHEERVQLARETRETETRTATDPVILKTNIELRQAQGDYPDNFDELQLVATALAKKDEKKNIPFRGVSTYFKEASKIYQTEKKVVSIEEIKKKEKKPIISEHPSTGAGSAPRTDLSKEEALDVGMKKAFGKTGRERE